MRRNVRVSCLMISDGADDRGELLRGTPTVVGQPAQSDTAARARGRVGGRRPRLTSAQALHAQQLYDAGEHTVQQIADLLQVPRPTVYGHLDKTSIGKPPTAGKAPPPHA